MQKVKANDFMLFFDSDQDSLMKNPDQLYTLMFNHLGKHSADIAMDRFKVKLPRYLPPNVGFYMDTMTYSNYMMRGGGMGPNRIVVYILLCYTSTIKTAKSTGIFRRNQ